MGEQRIRTRESETERLREEITGTKLCLICAGHGKLNAYRGVVATIRCHYCDGEGRR